MILELFCVHVQRGACFILPTKFIGNEEGAEMVIRKESIEDYNESSLHCVLHNVIIHSIFTKFDSLTVQVINNLMQMEISLICCCLSKSLM